MLKPHYRIPLRKSFQIYSFKATRSYLLFMRLGLNKVALKSD